MGLQLTAIGIFVATFAIATLRNVHLGITMFAAACGAGVWLAHMPLKDVVEGFPISIMVLLVGVTYFFAIAQANETVDRMIEMVLGRVGHIAALLPKEAGHLATRMEKYPNMQFADACVVRLSELLPNAVVYTTDKKDFSIYRRRGRETIKIVTP